MQGSKKKVTNKPTTKAPFGEVIFLTKFLILGRKERGISVAVEPGL